MKINVESKCFGSGSFQNKFSEEQLFRSNHYSLIRQYVSHGLVTETDQETAQLLFPEYFFSLPENITTLKTQTETSFQKAQLDLSLQERQSGSRNSP